MSDSTDPTRRRFLIASASATAVAVHACTGGGPMMCMSGQPPLATGLTASSLAVGDLRRVSMNGVSIYVGRDAAGYYAMTAACTHMQCVLPARTDSANQLNCPCHSSIYSATGVLIQSAPDTTIAAQGNLPMYRINFTGTGTAATITVDACTTVSDRTQRFMPS